jgi:hypothetical protein
MRGEKIANFVETNACKQRYYCCSNTSNNPNTYLLKHFKHIKKPLNLCDVNVRGVIGEAIADPERANGADARILEPQRASFLATARK